MNNIKKSLSAATQVVLREARENGNDSPVDYGDAEAIASSVLEYVIEVLNGIIRVDECSDYNHAILDCIYELKK